MKNWLFLSCLVIGVGLMSYSGVTWWLQKQQQAEALQVAEQLLSQPVNEELVKEAFTPDLDEVIGRLTIPKLAIELPIVEGTAEHMLEKGVGHYRTTAFPGEGEQILFSGHRDTQFKQFDQLLVGDQFIVEMPYGTFTYEMQEAEIVPADDRTVIGKKGEEVLTLSTCYPFGYIGYAPDRYIIYAKPIN